MKCLLCETSGFKERVGQVRDNPDLKILECMNCGLVTLNSFDHIGEDFYKDSGMHGTDIPSIESWKRNTEIDDQRRYESLKPALINKKVLDFGCGTGGFLEKAVKSASFVAGVEPENRVRDYWQDNLVIYADLDEVDQKFDVITAFHTIEHLVDPLEILEKFSSILAPDGQIIIEVPSANDALLTLYECSEFQKFTYWSQHLYLFTPETLTRLIKKSSLEVNTIQQFQRYPLSNHLYWLSVGKPGGHAEWSFIDSPALSQSYAAALAALGKCDTLIAHIKLGD